MDNKRTLRSDPAPRVGQDKKRAVAAAWTANAVSLAEWAFENLVNRRDRWGQYLPLVSRTEKQKTVTRAGLLTLDILNRHFAGQDVGDLIGLHTTSSDNHSRWVAVDIDHHGDRDPDKQRLNRKAAIALYKQVKKLGLSPLLISSNGRGGYHLLVLFAKPAPTDEAYAFARWLVRDWQQLGLAESPETFPKQPKIGGKVKYGNWLRLPGRHHTLPYYSRVWTGKRWASGADAIRVILDTTGKPFSLVPFEARTYDPEAAESPERQPEDRRRRTLRSTAQGRPIENVLALLRNVTRSSNGWSARCPTHNDHNNSLSIGEGEDRRVLLKCHAGCPVERIVEALEISMRDLFARGSRRRWLRSRPKERS